MSKYGRGALLVLCLAAVLGFYIFDLNRFFNLAYLKEQRQTLLDFYAHAPWGTAAVFLGLYVLMTALSFPGATVISLAGGMIFGAALGTVLVSVASTAGATLAFLSARWLFAGWLQKRFPQRYRQVQAGFAKDGGFYLSALRLAPVFPFFLVNLLMGLTGISVGRYAAISMLAMLPGTFLYVNAGAQLGRINALSEVMTPQILLSLLALAVFPLLARAAWRRAHHS